MGSLLFACLFGSLALCWRLTLHLACRVGASTVRIAHTNWPVLKLGPFQCQLSPTVTQSAADSLWRCAASPTSPQMALLFCPDCAHNSCQPPRRAHSAHCKAPPTKTRPPLPCPHRSGLCPTQPVRRPEASARSGFSRAAHAPSPRLGRLKSPKMHDNRRSIWAGLQKTLTRREEE